MSKILTPWIQLEELEKINKEAFGRALTEDESEDFRILVVGALNQLSGIVDQIRGDIPTE